MLAERKKKERMYPNIVKHTQNQIEFFVSGENLLNHGSALNLVAAKAWLNDAPANVLKQGDSLSALGLWGMLLALYLEYTDADKDEAGHIRVVIAYLQRVNELPQLEFMRYSLGVFEPKIRSLAEGLDCLAVQLIHKNSYRNILPYILKSKMWDPKTLLENILFCTTQQTLFSSTSWTEQEKYDILALLDNWLVAILYAIPPAWTFDSDTYLEFWTVHPYIPTPGLVKDEDIVKAVSLIKLLSKGMPQGQAQAVTALSRVLHDDTPPEILAAFFPISLSTNPSPVWHEIFRLASHAREIDKLDLVLNLFQRYNPAIWKTLEQYRRAGLI